MTEHARDKVHLGFLRIVATDAGFVGGILVTNRLGRPLEFQCTTPVKANRTQEILYGRTLEPFLFSELIGVTLVERLQIKPDLILVNQSALLALREHIAVPLACLEEETAERLELPDETRIGIGGQSLCVHPDHAEDIKTIQQLTSAIPGDADLREPLDRVRDALDETVRPGAAA